MFKKLYIMQLNKRLINRQSKYMIIFNFLLDEQYIWGRQTLNFIFCFAKKINFDRFAIPKYQSLFCRSSDVTNKLWKPWYDALLLNGEIIGEVSEKFQPEILSELILFIQAILKIQDVLSSVFLTCGVFVKSVAERKKN